MSAALPQSAWWRGRRVLRDRHTGFVGGWLCTWLDALGARVSGYSLPAPTEPSFFELTGIASLLERSVTATCAMPRRSRPRSRRASPRWSFHLAAQPIVREPFASRGDFRDQRHGHGEPARGLPPRAGPREDRGLHHRQGVPQRPVGAPFRGGRSPRRQRALQREQGRGRVGRRGVLGDVLAPRAAGHGAGRRLRAGNIVGGGDWARERLLPDAMRAFAAGRPLVLRSPGSTRPWQHVLDAVRGTLLLAERMPAPDAAAALAWNLGPPAEEVHSVGEVADEAVRAWGEGASWRHEPDASIPDRARWCFRRARAAQLGWRCRWGLRDAVGRSGAWVPRSERPDAALLDFTPFPDRGARGRRAARRVSSSSAGWPARSRWRPRGTAMRALFPALVRPRELRARGAADRVDPGQRVGLARGVGARPAFPAAPARRGQARARVHGTCSTCSWTCAGLGDLREWDAIELSAERGNLVLIPRGFAHGFCVVSDTAVVELPRRQRLCAAVRGRARLGRPGARHSLAPAGARAILRARPRVAAIGRAGAARLSGAVAIAGASGLIGQAIASRLEGAGRRILRIGRAAGADVVVDLARPGAAPPDALRDATRWCTGGGV